MDHHNSLLGVCIAYRNKKFYILAMFYAAATLINVIAFCAPIVVEGHTEQHRDNVHRTAKFVFVVVLFVWLVRELLSTIRRLAENVMKVEEEKSAKANEEFQWWLYSRGALDNFY